MSSVPTESPFSRQKSLSSLESTEHTEGVWSNDSQNEVYVKATELGLGINCGLEFK